MHRYAIDPTAFKVLVELFERYLRVHQGIHTRVAEDHFFCDPGPSVTYDAADPEEWTRDDPSITTPDHPDLVSDCRAEFLTWLRTRCPEGPRRTLEEHCNLETLNAEVNSMDGKLHLLFLGGKK